MLRVAVALLLLSPLASALPTPGINGAAFEPVHGRIFPEALLTNDYIGYEEAIAGLDELNSRHPERMEIREIGETVGWVNPLTNAREPNPLFVVEVTNEASELRFDQKLKVVFSLSIHGNEKGGREGGFRAIEDLVAGLGILEEDPDLEPMLDYMVFVFLFPNLDGWRHEEIQYRTREACYFSLTCPYGSGGDTSGPGAESQNFVRVNGNGIDLNRQFPDVGYRESGPIYETLSQPESQALSIYLKNLTRVVAGVDIHGMLQHDYYYLILYGGGGGPAKVFAGERLAELAKERVNANPYYRAWSASPHVDGFWGGEGRMAEWMSGNDAIGYSASGSMSGFLTSELGLDAPGFTIELAYNHITVDNYYPGAGAVFNDMHVRAVRDTVLSFAHFGSEQVQVSIATGGVRLAWLATDFVATNKDDDKTKYKGWFVESPADDPWDILHNDFEATPNDWFLELASVASDGDRPGVVTELRSAAEVRDALGRHDTLVVAGSAAKKLATDPAAISDVRAFVERGGRLVLTDEALELLVPLGVVTDGAVEQVFAYGGYTDLVDLSDPVAKGLRGYPRHTFMGRDLGYIDGQVPVWYVTGDAFNGTGGVALGTVSTSTTGVDAASGAPIVGGPRGVNLGTIPLGAGEIRILGAALPDPTEENDHPYGLASHALTAAGNILLLNLLGYDFAYEAPPVVIADLARVDDILPGSTDTQGEGGDRGVPGAPLALVAAFAAVAAFALRRRR